MRAVAAGPIRDPRQTQAFGKPPAIGRIVEWQPAWQRRDAQFGIEPAQQLHRLVRFSVSPADGAGHALGQPVLQLEDIAGHAFEAVRPWMPARGRGR